MKIEDLVYIGDACCGYSAQHTFQNGITATVTKTRDGSYSIACSRDGMRIRTLPVLRELDASSANIELAKLDVTGINK